VRISLPVEGRVSVRQLAEVDADAPILRAV
jgi:hypothetical protein